MRTLFRSFCAAVALCALFSMIPFSAQCRNISKEVFRLHILADSDSREDQALKLKVRDRVLEYTRALYKTSKSVSDAEALTEKSLQSIANVAKTEVEKNGYDYPVRAELRRMYFDTRYYGRVTMPSGMYDALRITIGKGEGHNWWCVMYPSLCVGASTDYNSLKEKTNENEYSLMTEDKYVFKFRLVEYFEKICSFFS